MQKRVCNVYVFQLSFHFCIPPLVVGCTLRFRLDEVDAARLRAAGQPYLNMQSFDLAAALDVHRMDPMEAANLTIRQVYNEKKMMLYASVKLCFRKH